MLLVSLSAFVHCIVFAIAGKLGKQQSPDMIKGFQEIADDYARVYKQHIQNAWNQEVEYTSQSLNTDASGQFGLPVPADDPHRKKTLEKSKFIKESGLEAWRKNKHISKYIEGVKPAEEYDPAKEVLETARASQSSQKPQRSGDTRARGSKKGRISRQTAPTRSTKRKPEE